MDVLAVPPGRGGKPFQKEVLPKVAPAQSVPQPAPQPNTKPPPRHLDLRPILLPTIPSCPTLPLLIHPTPIYTPSLHHTPASASQPPHRASSQVTALRTAYPSLSHIMVDGGIDQETARLAAAAGANVLVSGSFLFGAPPGQMAERLDALEQALLQHGE